MLVPSMNNKEITKDVTKDFEILWNSSTLNRLQMEYYMERKRAKVKKDAEYTKFYDIKTKSKNTWIVKFSKDPLLANYNTSYDCFGMMYAYYRSEHGIRVFSLFPNKSIAVYNGHLFSRYRERMKLNVPDSLDIVKRYIYNNYNVTYKYMPEKDGRCKFMGLVKEGFIMGEYIIEDRWHVFKTFISKTTSGLVSNEFEIDAMKKFKEELMNNDKELNNYDYNKMVAIYRTLIPAENGELFQRNRLVK